MNADSGRRGEQLSAYLAGELDADERAALEAELARDPALRARLGRVRMVGDALERLPEPVPPDGLRQRILSAAAPEIAGQRADELAERRERRARTLRPLAVAAAAAAVIGVVGVGAGYVLGGGGDAGTAGGETAAMEEMAATADSLAVPQVAVEATDNDFDSQELSRLAVNVDTTGVLPPGLTADEAVPLSERLLGQLLRHGADDTAADGDAERAAEPEADQGGGEALSDAADETSPVARCLSQLVDAADGPVVPVYVELARFEGEPAVIYALATPEPDSGEYRRIEVWAVARSDCHVLQFTQYDRPG